MIPEPTDPCPSCRSLRKLIAKLMEQEDQMVQAFNRFREEQNRTMKDLEFYKLAYEKALSHEGKT